jgi:hypothetical protein
VHSSSLPGILKSNFSFSFIYIFIRHWIEKPALAFSFLCLLVMVFLHINRCLLPVAVETERTKVAQFIGALVAEGHHVVNVKYWSECHGAEVAPVALASGYY